MGDPDFDNFNQVHFGVDSRNEQPCFREPLAVIVVEFVAMTMAFGDFVRAYA